MSATVLRLSLFAATCNKESEKSLYLTGTGRGKKEKMKKRSRTTTTDAMDTQEDRQWDFKTIMKDIEKLGASHMTWKDKKALENKKVVDLGGKPPKNRRLPLSVALPQMKNQKKREEKMRQMLEQEHLILGRFGAKRGSGSGSRRSGGKRKPEDRVLKASEGRFRNGVLDVKHLLNPTPSRDDNSSAHMISKGRKSSGSGKKNKGKKKGGGRKRH
ncbi:hypothetical protein Tsubulata_007868 [Turnera subulata]|uniref:Uncharacterized protein n=1 Tax=Turnera subulata TaxID=218843 RepID=A0A9Q0JPZ6_9ROSI|nr:hypothetical protein Tsubulata_007868 [Turnera subulata]